MTHIVWTDDLNTGISVIDKQHHRIVEYINNLYDIRDTHDREQLGNVLQELVDYTLSHFSFEESLMEEAQYPFINGHKKVHDMFTRRVGEFMKRFESGEDITDELLITLRSWLINHIKTDDNDYADAVKTSMHLQDEHEHDGWLAKSVRRFFG
jgi:hemerythrin